jgi:hypothetical protein
MHLYKGFVEEVISSSGGGGCLGNIGCCGVILFLILTLPVMCLVIVIYFIAFIAYLLH